MKLLTTNTLQVHNHILSKLLIVLLFVLSCDLIYGQSLSRKVLSNGGKFENGGNVSLSYTIGQTFDNYLISANNDISQGYQQPDFEIKIISISDFTFCAGDSIEISFVSFGLENSSNLTVQLSNPFGSFQTFTNLGITSNSQQGIIKCLIPLNVASGVLYRIRLASYQPVLVSADNGVDLHIRTGPPNQPGTIIGAPLEVCPPLFGLTLSIPLDSDVDEYHWYSPNTNSGVVFSPISTTSNQLVDLLSTPNSNYNIRVIAWNACGSSPFRGISIRRSVSTPLSISGPTTVCQNQVYQFECPPINGALRYVWDGPSGSLVNGASPPVTTTSNIATVTFPGGFTSGTIKVASQVGCFTSPFRSLNVSSSKNIDEAISGPNSVCPSQIQTFSVPAYSGVSQYIWTIPNGLSGVSITNSIDLLVGSAFSSGNVCVSSISICGVQSVSKCKTIVSGVPARPSTIIGPNNSLCFQQVDFSCPSISGLTYQWTLPPNVGLNSGQGTNSINTTFNLFNTTGNVCVTAINNCGVSQPRCLVVKGAPSVPNPITTTPASWCSNQSVVFNSSMTGSTSNYILNWTYSPVSVASYLAGGGNSNNYTLLWNNGQGQVRVSAQNSCGNATRSLQASNGCKIESNIENQISELVISPNPTRNLLRVELGITYGSYINWKIADVTGKIVKKGDFHRTNFTEVLEISTFDLTQGCYNLIISAKNHFGNAKFITVE